MLLIFFLCVFSAFLSLRLFAVIFKTFGWAAFKIKEFVEIPGFLF